MKDAEQISSYEIEEKISLEVGGLELPVIFVAFFHILVILAAAEPQREWI